MTSFRTILTLSILGTREWIRLKFFNIIIFLAVVFLGFSYLLSSLSFGVQERLMFDFGLGGLELGLVFTSAMIGSYAIQREIDRKTLFVLLVRPIPRWHIVVGSFGSLKILNALFAIGFSISLLLASDRWNSLGAFSVIVFSSYLKALVLASFALAMGILVRPILSLAMTFCYWILCYSVPDIEFFIKKLNSENLNRVVKVLDTVTPQFYRYNWKSFYYMNNPPTSQEFLWSLFYSIGWVLLWLFVASWVFRKKEIV